MDNLKKLISIMLILCMTILNFQDISIYANESNKLEKISDITPPELDIDSLKVDQTEVKPGDTVKISFKATDDISGIDSSWTQIHYKKPISGGTIGTTLRYNQEKDVYEGYIDIENGMEEGVWKVDYIHLRDNKGNKNYIDNNDGNLDNGNFTVLDKTDFGWRQIDGKWYFYGDDGKVKTGWLNDNGKWYYLRSNGEMSTGWEKVNGKWYYLQSNGVMKTGWLNDNGIWYYLHTSGEMATNTIIDGWKIDSNGVATPLN